MKYEQQNLFKNWHGHETTPEEFELCQKAHAWSVDWDLPVPDGIEEAYEKTTGKSCVYWGREGDSCPSDDALPRSSDYVTNGYTEGFYTWLESKIFESVRVLGLKSEEEIWKRIAEA